MAFGTIFGPGEMDRYFIRRRVHKAKSLVYNEAVHLKYKNIHTQIYIIIY